MEEKQSLIKCNVLEQLIYNKKTPALFIGAGFSKRYLNDYVNWIELLCKIGKKLNIEDFVITSKFDTLTNDGVSDGEAKQQIASYLSNELNRLIENGKVDSVFNQEDKDTISKNNLVPFKYLTASIMNKTLSFKNDKTYYDTELKWFKRLANKLPCILTTNYDNLLETLFQNQYTTFIDQSDYFYKSSGFNAEIYKLHGCISKPNSIILTKEDYDNFSNKAYLTTAKILNIASTYPIIFIGYSLNDKDINFILEKLLSCLTDKQSEELQKNIILVNRKESTITMFCGEKEIKLPNKSLRVTYITTDNFTRLFQYLNDFKPVVTPVELKRFNSTFKTLILKNDRKLQTIVAQAADLNKIPDTVAIENIGIKAEGYDKLPNDRLTVCALYEDSKAYDAQNILNKWFKKHTPYNVNVPLYYFEKICKIQKLAIDPEIKNKLKSYKADKLHLKLGGSKNTYTSKKLNLELVKTEYDSITKIKMLMHHYQESVIELQECIDWLKKFYTSENTLASKAEFRKAVVIIDRDRSKI